MAFESSVSSSAIPRQARRHLVDYLFYLLAFIVLLLVWEAIPRYIVNPVFFATPQKTFHAAIELARSGQLLDYTLITLRRIFEGFALGSGIGAAVGLIMGTSKVVRYLVEPHLEFFRFIPSIALIPVTITWLGIGETQKLSLIMWTTTFIVTINTLAGVVAVAEISQRAARTLGANRLQVFRHVIVPSTVPYIIAGMKLAMVNAFGTVVIAEMVASNSGLGYLILTAQFSLRADRIFVGIVMLALLGFVSDRIFRLAALKLTGRYGTKL
jgi:ABC-type nitrate/sulfonate/bicarbonate transport system permease component